MPQFEVIFYERENGARPVEEFMLQLDAKMRAKLTGLLEILAENGNQLREPYSKPMEDGIFELRCKVGSNITRVLYFFYYKLHIFPGPGRLSNSFSAPATVTGMYVIDSLIEGNPAKALDALQHLILPGLVLAAFTMGLITRTTRSNLLDVMSTDYIRTARAKGLSRVGLIVRHALGNALIPVLTVIGLGLGNLLGGMVLVETIFNWPGVGQFAYESVLSVDYPSIIGVALLIALNYMVINTVVDILYGVIDPRVRCNG